MINSSGNTSNSSTASVNSLERSSSRATSDTSTSVNELDLGCLSLESKYVEFEKYLKWLIKLCRHELVKDHTFERLGLHFSRVAEYHYVRDCIHVWFAVPENRALFSDRDTYFYIAEMKVLMDNIERSMALPSKVTNSAIAWPGAESDTHSSQMGVDMKKVYRLFDELVLEGKKLRTELLPWNRECNGAMDDCTMTG